MMSTLLETLREGTKQSNWELVRLRALGSLGSSISLRSSNPLRINLRRTKTHPQPSLLGSHLMTGSTISEVGSRELLPIGNLHLIN